jgi:AraC-like DNA-binding protein
MAQIHSQILYRSTLVAVTDHCCRPSDSAFGGEEQSPVPSVVFPRAGLFVWQAAGRRVVADANHVLFFNPGVSYRVGHPVPGGDDCTSFAFGLETLVEVLSAYEPAAHDRPGAPFPHTHGPTGPRTLLRGQLLRQQLRGAEVGALAVEESALGVLHEVVGASYRVHGVAPRRRPATARAYRERVEATKTFLAARLAGNPSLAAVARAVHCSPYHLARLFREQVGMPIHQYGHRLRLAAALERLADGVADLTALALDLGFSSHSHFTHAFRRAFGTPPAAFRRTARPGRLREMSKNLTA